MPLKTTNAPFKKRLEESKADTFMQEAVAKAQDAQWIKREDARKELGNWQEWRDLGESIRQHVLAYLPDYLDEFSQNVVKHGGHVLFAENDQQARDFVKEIIEEKQAKKVVKSKSMVTTEIGLDEMMEALTGVSVMETDLAEFILQLDNWDEPTHIVFPALHKNREQIRQLFAEKLGYTGDNDPKNLAACAREEMRKFFLEADIGITGCNFAIANSGMINLDTNEGNADLTLSIPKTQIVLMGMERLVPSIKEAEILDTMLARSAVGQNLTTYVTFCGPKATNEVDGPDDFYVIILDNGRSNALGTIFQPMLQCIRCGACLNVCPVYRHIGGHGYGSIYPGPMGSVLSPILDDGYDNFKELPYACSLCAACTETCPVKIPLHELLIQHRKVITNDLKLQKGFENFQMKVVGLGTGSPFLFQQVLHISHVGLLPLRKKGPISAENLYHYEGFANKVPGLVKGWTDVRDLPMPPKYKDNFRPWFKQHKGGVN